MLDPDLFAEELTDKKNEAVANTTRFNDAGKRRNELANADYEAKMTAIFAGSSKDASRRRRLDRHVHPQTCRGVGHAWDGAP